MAELKSLLSNPDFLARASVSDVLANALEDPEFRKTAAVASSEGNDIADDDTFISDLNTLSYYDLEAKRGRKVADNRSLFQKELARQVKVRDAKPSIGDVVVDTGIAAGTAITSMIGGLSVAGVGLAGAAIEATTGNVGVSRLSTDMSAVLSKATDFMTTGMSDTQLDKAELNAIESNLDQKDSTARMQRKIADGMSPFRADLERQGEDFLNFGDRFYKDPYVATNLVAGALGSLWPSAKLAQGGVILAEKLAARIGNKFGTKIAGTIGSSLGIGFAESSGTFVDTSAFVMGLSEEDMWHSPEYALLRSEGKSHEQAQSVVATTTATEASARQLPTAAVLGLVAAKFNANPFKVFRGKGTVNYFREVGIQAFEEGAQGFSSVLNRNLAIQNQVNADTDIGAGLGEALGEGVFAGMGMAGVIGAPSLARSGASAAISAAVAGAQQIPLGALGQGASAVGTAGADALDFAARTGSKVAEATAPLRAKIAEKAKPVTEPVGKVVKEKVAPAVKSKIQKVRDFNERPSKKAHAENVAHAEAAAALAPDNTEVAAVRDVLISLTKTSVPNMTDDAVMSAAKALFSMKKAIVDYDPKLKKEAMLALASSSVIQIISRAKTIDLNQLISNETVVDKASIQISLDVAEINPVNVNPDHIDKILQQKDTNLTDDQIRIFKVAAKMARIVNTHQEVEVEISSEKSIALSKKPAYRGKDAPKVTSIEETSRSIQIKGFKDASGKDLRSLSDFVGDILEGVQSEDGTFINKESEVVVPVGSLIKQFGLFVEHLRNKVGALNHSIENPTSTGAGPTVLYRSLVGGRRMVNPGEPGNADGVFYHRDSPKSVATAQAIENDARVAAELYNTMVEAFPDQFPGGKVAIPKLSTPSTKKEQKQTPDTTAVEGVEATTGAETQAQPEAKDPGVTETTEQPKLTTSTPEEDAVIRKLNDELRALKKEATVLREAKDDITEQGAELETALDLIADQRNLIAAKDAEINAVFKARREASKSKDKPLSPEEAANAKSKQSKKKSTLTPPSEMSDAKLKFAIEDIEARKKLPDHRFLNPEATEAHLQEMLAEQKSRVDTAAKEETILQKFINRLKGKKTKIVVRNTMASLASYSKSADTIYINMEKIEADFNAGLTYIEGEVEGATSAQKAKVFENIDVAAFKKYIKEGGLNRYVEFILEHELAHVVQVARGDIYPRTKAGKADLMNDAAITLERAANEAGFKAIGFDTTAVDETIAPLAAIDEEAGTQTEEEDDDGKARIAQAETTETEKVTPEPTEKFTETFDQRVEEVDYESGNDILNLLNVGTNTTEGYRRFANKIFTKLINGMNARLKTVTLNKHDDATVQDKLLAGDDLTHIRNFKNTMIVDPETGEYNPELLSMAVVAMIDWMSSVRPVDARPRKFKETLKNLGVNASELTHAEYQSILHGVQPTLVAETLAKTIIRMWNMKINQNRPMIDGRGAVEGLVKEMLTVVVAEFDYIKIEKVPTKGATFATTPTLNVKGLRKVQGEIGLEGRNSVQKLLDPEEDRGPSIGKKITTVPEKNRRGTVDLSKKEKEAVKTEQDTPHTLAQGITGLIKAVGFEVYKKLQGWKPVEHLAKNHPLRNSIEGKNISIEHDWEDAHSVTDLLLNQDIPVPVYFRIEISQVGRHQHSGINSQNNKTLRVMVSPSGNVLDMTNQDDIDGFWLTIAQSSGLGENFKVENILHEEILATIQQAFAKKYGKAIEKVENYLETSKLDAESFFEATGEIEMETLNAIFAVADLNNQSRKTNALTEFYVTMGFELDGKTDGAAHMLNNFGQGLLTKDDYENFQRVGLFLGTTRQTLNKFFSEGAVDMYRVASKKGMNKLYSDMATSGENVKAALYASSRFAAAFGNFELGPDGLPEMTRDTIKNPMTQTVYGAGLFGVARGISEDMVLGFYKKMIAVPKGQDPAEYLGYPTLAADFELLFGKGAKYNPKQDWTHSWIDKASMDYFVDIITEGIGDMIATAAKEVIGDPIVRVNDLLVFITNVQTEFLVDLFNRRLKALAEELAKDGKVRRNNKGVAIVTDISPKEYNKLIKSMEAYAPRYDNGIQTLAVGGFGPAQSNVELSANMEGDFRMKSTLILPEIAGVKVIPYLTQGRGDAAVVNKFFSSKGAPTDVMAVHDGFYVPIKKIKQYSKRVNEVVMDVWDRDVLGDAVKSFEQFINLVGSDVDLFRRAMKKVNDYKYETTVEAKTSNELMMLLREYHRQNMARTEVLRKVPKSVDHLAGANEAATRNENKADMDRHEINDKISDRLGQPRITEKGRVDDEAAEDQEEQSYAFFRAKAAREMKAATEEAAKKDNTEIIVPDFDANIYSGGATEEGGLSVVISDTNAIMDILRKSSNRLAIRQTVKALVTLMGDNNYKVVISNSAKDLAAKYDLDKGEGSFEEHNLEGTLGWTDLDTGVMYILSNTHETLAHELIHLATFLKVEAHYKGEKTNNAVVRLETLMESFMKIDFSKAGKTLQNAANSAKAQILDYQTKDTPFAKAAALNEFMAWSLTSAALVKELSKRDGGVLAQMGKKVIKLIQRILGNKIPNTMYNHILFNTLLLSDTFEQHRRNEQAVAGLIEQDAKNKIEGRDPFTNQKIGSVKLPGEGRFIEKDQKKADKANKFIGRGSSKSSTRRYAVAYGDNANSGNYEATDIVFISAEGQRQGRLSPDTLQIQKAIDAGVMFITDVIADRTRPYNLGERQVAEYLSTHGYKETSPGVWNLEKSLTEQATLIGSEEFSPALIDEGDTGPATEASDTEGFDTAPTSLDARRVEAAKKRAASREKVDDTTVSEIEAKNEVTLDDLLDTGDTGGVGNGDNNDNGNEDGGLTPAAHEGTNFWIKMVKKRLADTQSGRSTEGAKARAKQLEKTQNDADQALTKLDFGGFIMTAYEKKTFKAIHMVLATELGLNVQSSVAIHKIYEFIFDNLKPEMFGPGKQGQDLYATVRDLLGDTKNEQGITDAMAVLLSLSQTSKLFREALEQLDEIKGEDIKIGTLNQFLTTMTGILMNKLVGTVDLSGKGARELLDVLANNLIREDTNNEFTLLSGLMGAVSVTDKFVSGAFSTLAERTAKVDREVQASKRTALTKLVMGTVTTMTAFLDADRAEALGQIANRLTHMGTTFDNMVMVREFVSEIVGTNMTNAEIMKILDQTTYEISAVRQDYKENLPVIFQNAFKTSPDAEQWKAVHIILGRLGIADIFDTSSPERTLNLLSDNSLLSSETAAKEREIIRVFPKRAGKIILEKAKQLAGHMNRKGAGHQLWPNAYAINKLAGKYDETMTKAIDELISLYALEIVDQSQKDIVSKMYDNDPEAITTMITYIQALNKEEDLKNVSEKALMNGIKGYIPDLGAKNSQVRIADDAEGDELIKMGWTRVGDYTAEAKWSSTSRGYYVTSVKQGGAYAQGAMQTVQGSYRGVNALTGMIITGQVSGILDPDSVDAATASLNAGTGVVDDKEVVIPLYDENGNIDLYQRMINPDILEQYTRPKSNLALMLGAWGGRQIEEKQGALYNRVLVDELLDIWNTRTPGDEELFVDLSDPNLKDPIYKDSWDVIPPDTKNYIKTKFGNQGGFMVKKEQMNIALGFRMPSIVDMWTGKTRMPELLQTTIKAITKVTMGNLAVTILSRGEEGIHGTISTAKDLIVVRSLIVPYMNTQANIFQLSTRGVPLKTMVVQYRDKYVEIERFNENTKRWFVLQTKIALAGNDKNQVTILKQDQQTIEDENKRMSIFPLIKAGQYKNISEGITDMDVELTTGRIAEWVENQVNKLPGTVQTIAKYGLLSKDTAVYKAANKAVQYGDFLAKSILYDHYLAQGMDKTEALRKVAEEYVNFTVLPGRMRSGLEALGATWFLAFKIRITKVAMNILRENPARALIMATTFGDVGSPVGDNLPVVIAEHRFPYSLGWEMLFAAPELHPYANMIDWDGI